MTRYFRFILRHRALVLGFCVGITALAGLSTTRAIMASSLGQLIFGDMPEYRRYMERVTVFGGDEQLIVMTSLIFAAGFLPFAASTYLSFRMLGILLPITMLAALAADLLLLPALVTVGVIRKA